MNTAFYNPHIAPHGGNTQHLSIYQLADYLDEYIRFGERCLDDCGQGSSGSRDGIKRQLADLMDWQADVLNQIQGEEDQAEAAESFPVTATFCSSAYNELFPSAAPPLQFSPRPHSFYEGVFQS